MAVVASAPKVTPAKPETVEAAERALDGQWTNPNGECKKPDGQCKTATEDPQARPTMCPMCRMMSGKMATSKKGGMPMDPQAMMQQCMGMMQQAGVPAEMMRRCQVMMNTPVFLDSPCAVFGQAEVLGLSAAQKKQLRKIENEAREKAMAVLTAEQRDKMGKVPTTPMAMAQVCQQMCGKMMPMMQKMMPMMQKMRSGQNGPAGSGTKSPK